MEGNKGGLNVVGERAIKTTLHRIIFGTDTKAGRGFDLVLLVCILCSVTVFMLDSVPTIKGTLKGPLSALEWGFTIVFSMEYLLRIYVSPKPVRYVLSFWGLVDLVALLPAYLSLLLIGSHYLGMVRALCLLRVFRILKLARHGCKQNLPENASFCPWCGEEAPTRAR